jgi:transketolase
VRKEFVKVVTESFEISKSTILLLGDIGVFGFSDLKQKFDNRVLNMGILEQSMVGIAAGLSMKGFIPTVHTIAPFMVERAFEQLKIDFGYQKLAGNFVSVGASFDYAALGCTHHCPGDVPLMHTIPNTTIFIPGNQREFSTQYRENWNNGSLNYFRLSEKSHVIDLTTSSEGVTFVKGGSQATVLVVGPLLQEAFDGLNDLDVSLIYVNEISAKSMNALAKMKFNEEIFIIEPYYSGTLSTLLIEKGKLGASKFYNLGVPRVFLENYGNTEEHLKHIGLNSAGIRESIRKVLYE